MVIVKGEVYLYTFYEMILFANSLLSLLFLQPLEEAKIMIDLKHPNICKCGFHSNLSQFLQKLEIVLLWH